MESHWVNSEETTLFIVKYVTMTTCNKQHNHYPKIMNKLQTEYFSTA